MDYQELPQYNDKSPLSTKYDFCNNSDEEINPEFLNDEPIKGVRTLPEIFSTTPPQLVPMAVTASSQEPVYKPSEKDIEVGVSRYSSIMGITCYMNVILHILQQLPIFSHYISEAGFRNVLARKFIKEKIPDTLTYELYRTFRQSLEFPNKQIIPTKLKTIVGKYNDMWNEHKQQDAQEFFNFVIGKIEDEVCCKSKFIPGNDFVSVSQDSNVHDLLKMVSSQHQWEQHQLRQFSPMKKIFDGMLLTTKTCSVCGTSSNKFEPFTTLSLSIDAKSNNIDDCLAKMVEEEQMEECNKYLCDFCGVKNRSFTKTQIWKPPKILVIHLKRFSINDYGIPTGKITRKIEYPITNFSIEKFVDSSSPSIKSSSYDLTSVVLHQGFGGDGINFGHYTALVKSISNHKWQLFNDDKPVEEQRFEEDIIHQNAYMLFYYRHD